MRKAFGATGIRVNRTTSLTFRIINPNSAARLTGISFVDTLPAGLIISTPNGLLGPNGGGTITALAGSNAISLSGASLAAGESIELTVNVTGADIGTKNNITSAISSIEGGAGETASATLSVLAASPTASLAQLLALRVTIWGGGNRAYVTMASLISPTLAVMPYHAISGAGLSQGPEFVNGSAEFLGSSTPSSTIVTLLRSDPDRDLAVVELKSTAPFDLPHKFLSFIDVDVQGDWQSYLAPAHGDVALISGTLRGFEVFEGRQCQLLHVSEPVVNTEGLSGAPVIWNGQLIGIVSYAQPNDSSWRGSPISRRILLSIPGVFMATKEGTEWLDKATIARFTDDTWAILNSADQIREQRNGHAVSAFDLVLAFGHQQSGQLPNLLAKAGVTLDSLIPPTIDASAEGPPEDVASGTQRKFPRITQYVRLALVRARDTADAMTSAFIDDSHLLFGLLSLNDTDNLLIQGFNRQGITPDKVKLSNEATPGTETSRPQAGYKSDDPTGEDLLDISKEVNALASVLAGKDVEPPLSLGLFGDWGTGKSFFMRRLEGRIRDLTEDAKHANGESQYCQDVVQLTFNAWNYIDKDLWASLAAEIFEGLAAALAQKRGGDSQAGRSLALAAASSSQTVVAETERQKSVAEAQLRESEAQLAELQRNQKNIQPRLSASEVLNQAARFAVKDDNLRKQAQEAAQEIGISKGIMAVGDIQKQLLDLKNIWTEIIFSIRNNDLWILGLASLAALGVGWGGFFLVKRYVGDFAKTVITIFVAASTFLAALRAGSRKILNFVRKIKASKQELIDKTQHAVKEKIDQARESIEQATEAVKILNQQLENMRADRKMVDFIRQRYESSDYRAHLGTIARVRADFRHLSALLRDVQNESEKDFKEMKERQQEKDKERNTPLFPRIDRIILYVDDLDRCPEKNVVEVLQAVHLLLAFPLFVVVVGVDPRWLLHSLRKHSVAFESNGANAHEEEQEMRWESTPMNYLEKIFQIPFTLRPIDKSGFGKLVDSFAASSARTDGVEPPALTQQSQTATIPLNEPTLPEEPTSVVVSSELSSASGTTELPVPKIPTPHPSGKEQYVRLEQSVPGPVREPIDRYPEHLHIEEWERVYMKALHELIPSPRAGKRFINIYRLLRASVRANERERFVGDHKRGEYQCALMLLAILTGYPAEATEILRALIEEEHTESWGVLLRAFKARVEGESSIEKESNIQKVSKQGTNRLEVNTGELPRMAGFPTTTATTLGGTVQQTRQSRGQSQRQTLSRLYQMGTACGTLFIPVRTRTFAST